MGCCETRDKTLKESLSLKISEDSPSLESDIILNKVPSVDSVLCEYTLKIKHYLESIEDTADWVSAISDDNFSAWKTHGSKFQDKTLLSKLWVNMETYVPLNLILDLFLVPEMRLKWDTCLKSLSVVEGTAFDQISHYRIRVLFFSGEIIEKIKVFYDKDAVYIVSFSVEHEEFKEIKDYTRMHKVLGCVKVTEKNGMTQLIFTNQIDSKSKIESLMASVGIMQQKIWIEAFRKRVKRVMMNSKLLKFNI